MKKLLCILLLTCLALCIFTACGGKDGKDGLDGKDGVTPTIEISDDGYWIINGTKTDVKASSEDTIYENPQELDFYKQDDGTYFVSVGRAKYLSKIVIPATYKGGAVVGIDKNGFTECTSLTSITIPDSVTSIGDYAFEDCTSLTSVTIGNNATSIGNSAFYNCSSLASITIPDSVTTIGSQAFFKCTSLASITIPVSVTSIDNWAFSGCSSLTSVNISDIAAWCNISFGDFDSNPLSYAENLYLNGNLITALVIPEGVTSISDYAFENCTSLTSITIPDNVTYIGDDAFKDCSNLNYNEYNNAYYLGNLDNPYLVLVKAKNTYIDSVAIHEDTKFVHSAAFAYCYNLASVTIGKGVDSISTWAFYNCTSLTSVYYTGSEEEWQAISIGSNNSPITNATICYNYVPENNA